MALDEKDIVIRIKMTDDAASAKKTADDIKQVDKNLKDVNKSAEETKKRFAEMREGAEKVKQIGMLMAAAGAALTGPLLAAGKAYLDNAKALKEMAANGTILSQAQQKAVDTAERWNGAMSRVQDAAQRIGGVVIETVVPYLEKAADLAAKLADYAEKHPEAVKAALAVGTALIAGGGVVTMLGTIMQTVGAFGMLFGPGGMFAGGGAIGGSLKQLVGFLGPVGWLAIAIGALVALLNTEFGKSGVQAGKQGLALAAGGIAGTLTMNRQTGDQAFLDAAHALGLLTDEAYANATASMQAANATAVNTATQTQQVNILQQAWQDLTQFVGDIGQVIQDVWTAIVRWIEGAGRDIQATGDRIRGFLQQVGQYAANVWQQIVNGAAQMGQSISNIWQQIVNSVSNIGASINNVFTSIMDTINTVVQWIQDKLNSIKLPGAAVGGYVGSGVIQVGERGYEYVLNHSATQAAEAMAGGRLTQEKILSMMRGGSVHYSDQRRFYGMANGDRSWYRSDALTVPMLQEMLR